MSEYIKYEPTAREIAAAVIARSGQRIPLEILVEVVELVVDGVHDGIEHGEAYAALPSNQRPEGEIWMDGFLEGLSITDEGQGEQ